MSVPERIYRRTEAGRKESPASGLPAHYRQILGSLHAVSRAYLSQAA